MPGEDPRIDPLKMRLTIVEVVSLLASGRFEEQEALTGGIRLPAAEMRTALESYGHRIVALSVNDVSLDDNHVFPITDSLPPAWAVDVDLPDVANINDLTLSLLLIESAGDRYRVRIDDLHIL